MTIDANTVDEYLEKVAEDQKIPMTKLREIIKENLPSGFEECINYKMIGFVVPHAVYPAGYHCDPKLPLPLLILPLKRSS